ncbi:MAG: hemerythrin domain-containing protein [Hyphomicrobiaceae bacterium]|nr:hemerythrin domain-containing protein [Hyphomicrobiaceae bacterium]
MIPRSLLAASLATGLATFSFPVLSVEFSIPEPLAADHKAIHSQLQAATRKTGRTGEAATAAMRVLEPHFEKEERFALPQLGLLPTLAGQPLSSGQADLTPEVRKELIARTDRLRSELPQMLAEHKEIEAALDNMEKVAAAENQQDAAALAREIRTHAKEEELILYPAALLAGEYAKQQQR